MIALLENLISLREMTNRGAVIVNSVDGSALCASPKDEFGHGRNSCLS